MSAMEQTVSASPDEELVRALEAESEWLSSQVNESVRIELTRRRHRAQVHELLEGFESNKDPDDEALVDKYTELLT